MDINTPSIPKDQYRHPSENYAFLRQEAQAYVEKLASELWTDYNIHDPGITIMEALCLAITDLAYRTSFDIKDLLSEEGIDYTQPQPPLFTAREILTCNPWTATDWRKLLVDIDGVFNAWLFIASQQEVDFYADCKKSRLSYFEPGYKVEPKKLQEPYQPGITKIVSWMKGDGAAERNKITMPLSLEFVDSVQDNALRQVTLGVPLPGWEAINQVLGQYLPFVNLDQLNQVELINPTFDNEANTWTSDLRLRSTWDGNNHSLPISGITVEGVENNDMRNALESALQTLNPDNPFLKYRQYLWRRLSRLSEHTIQLGGLYDILLEYETDEVFGDLNSALLRYTLYIPKEDDEEGTLLQELPLEVVFPSWKTLYTDIKNYRDFIEAPSLTSVAFENEFFDEENQYWRTDLRFQYEGQGAGPDIVLTNVIFRGIDTQEELDAVKENMELLTEGSIAGYFHGKLKRLLEITDEVEARLHQYRNLCEDYIHIGSVCINEVAVCAEIELDPEAELESVQAEILFQLEQYLSPPIRFYTLQELVDRKVPSEEIFEGPPLDHGFILTEEIEATDLEDYQCIYASDMINLIMDIEGVRAVKDFLMTKYDDQGRAVLPSEPWTIRLDFRHKARLSIVNSDLLFRKGGLPYVLRDDRYQKMLKKLERLRALHDRARLLETENDFPIPEGTPRNFDDYTPLRFSFPDTYGVGAAGLADTASDARKGQAKQLQAYLAFFDQLLANYLTQLENVRQLFSLDIGQLKRTYYTQFLAEEKLGASLYTDAAVLEDAGSTNIGPQSLQRLVESEEEYLDRRNRFLDHLLARFAEQFTDYTLLMNTVMGNKAPQALIEDKRAFLEIYPEISSERGKAFNYKDETAVWNSANVPGLQKRMSRLLGMDNFQRRDLHCPTLRDFFVIEELLPDTFRFKLEREGNLLLTGVKTYSSEEDAFEAKEQLIVLARDENNYAIVENAGQFTVEVGDILRNPQGDILHKNIFAESESFNTDTEAEAFVENLLAHMKADFETEPCEIEGFHIIEHLLLRPKAEYEDALFTVCLSEDCHLCGEEDPYSCRVSVILPYWMQRFDDRQMQFREYIVALFRQEAPAHVHLKICWIDNEQMRQLDTYYRRWLEENAKRCPDPETLTRRLNLLIGLMEDLRNVYYEGFLHDCDDSEEQNTILLNKSFLGSFKPDTSNEEDA